MSAKLFVLMLCLGMQAFMANAELREFTDTKGRVIEAELISYNALREKVTVKLKGKGNKTVSISIFSETDQQCIVSWNKNQNVKSAESKTKPPITQTKELSKKQVKEIAEKYIEAILDKDYAAWTRLMASTAEVSERDFMVFYNQVLDGRETWLPGVYSELKRIKISEIEGSAVSLEFQSKDPHNSKGCLLILPDGKIKYDAIYVRHPIVMAKLCFGDLYYIRPFRATGIRYERSSSGLIKTGIPLLGWDVNASASDQFKSLDKIRVWLQENCNKWDSSEPKLFLPEEFTSDWFEAW